MKGIKNSIEKETIANKNFRKVIYTGNYMQLVYMSLKPGESIGLETHGNDQFFRFEQGAGKVIVDDTSYKVKDGDSVIVPAGAKHNITNTSKVDFLKLYTIYAVPHHKDGTVHSTKAVAEKSEEEFDGKTSE